MRKDLPPYSSACQYKTSQQFCFCSPSFKLLAHMTSLSSLFSFTRTGVNPGHTTEREILCFACLMKVCGLSLTWAYFSMCYKILGFCTVFCGGVLDTFSLFFRLSSTGDRSDSSVSYTAIFLQSCLYFLNPKNFYSHILKYKYNFAVGFCIKM